MAKEQDQSMEEILQSIKRIIAEEGEPAPSGSDVLELTDLLSEDTADVALANDPKNESLSIEEIMAAPIEPEYHREPLETPAAKEKPQAVDTSKKPREATEQVDLPSPPPPKVETAAPLPPEAPLASETTITHSSAALESLRSLSQEPPPPMPRAGMPFRAGYTVEDLVLEALRPMLKDWIDAHMAGTVERLVEREIRRINGGR